MKRVRLIVALTVLVLWAVTTVVRALRGDPLPDLTALVVVVVAFFLSLEAHENENKKNGDAK